jgi:hypothetical protein
MSASEIESALTKLDAAIDEVLAVPQLNQLQALRFVAVELASLPRERTDVPAPLIRFVRLGTALHEASHAVVGHSLGLSPSDLRIQFHVDASVGFPAWTEWMRIARDPDEGPDVRLRKALSLALVAAAGGAGQSLIGLIPTADSVSDLHRMQEALASVAIPADEVEAIRSCASILGRAFASQIGLLAVDAFREGSGGIVGRERINSACLPFNLEAAEFMRDTLVSCFGQGRVRLIRGQDARKRARGGRRRRDPD